MGSVDLFSKRKIDSPKFFQPQVGHHQSLFLRYKLGKRLRSVYGYSNDVDDGDKNGRDDDDDVDG